MTDIRDKAWLGESDLGAQNSQHISPEAHKQVHMWGTLLAATCIAAQLLLYLALTRYPPESNQAITPSWITEAPSSLIPCKQNAYD